MLDLQFCFVENAVEIAVRYRNLPAAFFRDTENMFRKAYQTLLYSDDTALRERFQTRITRILADSAGADGGLGNALLGIQNQLFKERLTALAGSVKLPVEPKATGISSAETAGETLSKEDANLFFRLWRPLMDEVNQKLQVNDLRDIASGEYRDAGKLKAISDALVRHPELIDAYLAEKGDAFNDDEKNILLSWKKPVSGRFILVRNLKKGSILISGNDDSVYLVHGLKSSFEEMFPYTKPPLILDATLLPFRDVIITDGLLALLSISIGGTLAKSLREQYMTAKRRGAIIESLE